MHGQWVEYTMTHWGESSFREARIDAIEGRAVSSDAIDSMMDALESRTRRVVLATLLDTSETSLATLERRASGTSSDLPDQRPPLARRRAEPVQLPAVDDDHVTPDREQFVDGDALGERRPPAVFAVGADGEDRSRSDRVEPVGVDGGPPVSRHVGPLPRDLSVAGVERPDRPPTEVDPSRRAVPVGPASPVGHFDDRRTIARRRYRQREPSVEIRVEPLTVPPRRSRRRASRRPRRASRHPLRPTAPRGAHRTGRTGRVATGSSEPPSTSPSPSLSTATHAFAVDRDAVGGAVPAIRPRLGDAKGSFARLGVEGDQFRSRDRGDQPIARADPVDRWRRFRPARPARLARFA